MVKSYLKDFLEKFSYPEEAKDVLLQAYYRIEAHVPGGEAFR